MNNRSFSFASLKGDIFGGFTAGIVALPLALAFGVASGAGVNAGLYGAIALGFFAALCGGTPTQISGPTGPMTVIFASTLAVFPPTASGELSPAIFTVVFLAGMLQILFGWLKLGGFVRYIPYPVISGFMSGIGVIIILLQLHPLLGVPSVSAPLDAIMRLPGAFQHADLASLGLGCLAMAIVFLTPARVTRTVPSPLLALLAGTLLAVFLHLDVPSIGEIPSGLPQLHVPFWGLGHLTLAHIQKLVPLALALAVLGSMDSLLTSVVADSMTKTHHRSNRELVGQGIGNMAAALVGGLPGAGATMRTVINIKAGGTTRISGMMHALLLTGILLGLGKYAAHIPMAVLAGILIKVGIDIMDYRLLKLARCVPKQDFAVMVTVFLITVFVDLIVAVGVGVTLAALLICYQIAQQARIQVEDASSPWQNDLERDIESKTRHSIRVITINGPFFFGSTARMQENINALIGAKVVVINCLAVPFIDLSGYFTLSEMLSGLIHERIKPIIIFKNDTAMYNQMIDLGYGKLLGEDGIQSNYNSALNLAGKYLEEIHQKEEEKKARKRGEKTGQTT
ncbi:MAG: SulP family inorganic anion transporter [bacterium]|nr:SulP family inorganic anion transporter [bacterium]